MPHDAQLLSDPLDLRIYLSDAEFRSRVLQSKAWADYLAQPPIPPFDELTALAEIAQRNAVRADEVPLTHEFLSLMLGVRRASPCRGPEKFGSGFRARQPVLALNIDISRKLMLKAAVLFTRLTTGRRLTDAHNGLRAMTRRGASALRIRQNRMAHASEILQQIAQSGLRYIELPATVEYTSYSMAKGQRLSNSVNILLELLTGALQR